MVRRAAAFSRAIRLDEPIGLAEVAPATADVALDLDGDVRGVPLAEKKRLLEAYNGTMLGVDGRIVDTQASYRDEVTEYWYGNSEGTLLHEVRPEVVLSGVAIARRDGVIEKGLESVGLRRGWNGAQGHEGGFRKVAERAVALLDAPGVGGGTYPVILDPELAGVFIHEAFGHLSEADFVYENPQAREMMTLGRRFGKPVLNAGDNGAASGLRGTLPFDDEGVPTQDTPLIREGILVGRLHSRETAAKLGKEIELITEGESTELDKSLTERIIDPLTHLVRNSLDHGIEPPEAREAAGKPRTGRLTLSARHQGGNILIEVSDDGAGLDRDRLLAKARENSLAVSDAMSDDEVWQLIFAPGFSTAKEVTDVSGRGVGMDVVKRNIQGMGGHVQIMSTPGEGTTIRIVLPLTLAILDGMSIKVSGEMFILPLSAVLESLQPAREDLYAMAGDDVVLKVRDEYLPVVAVHEALDVPGARTELTETIAVIVQGEGRRYALLVDDLVGQQQVVVKNLETNYRKVPGVSAATILGDGSVALILDITGLHRLSRTKKEARRPVRAAHSLEALSDNALETSS